MLGPARGDAAPGPDDHRVAGHASVARRSTTRRGGAVRRRLRRRVRPRRTPASTGILYGLQRGRLVSGSVGDLRVVDGPLGREQRRVRARSPSRPSATGRRRDRRTAPGPGRPAAVARRRRPGRHPGARRHRCHPAVLGRVGPAVAARPRPARRAGAGRRRRRRVREVEVPGSPGPTPGGSSCPVTAPGWSRSSTGPTGDQVVAARIVLDSTRSGRPRRRSRPSSGPSTGRTAIDVAWTASAEIAVLTPARPGELFEVETVAADGATVGVDTLSTIVPGRVIGLAGEPYTETPVFAVTRDALVDIRTRDARSPPTGSATSTTPAESPQARDRRGCPPPGRGIRSHRG